MTVMAERGHQPSRTQVFASRLPGWLALVGLAATVVGLVVGLADIQAAAPSYYATWPRNDDVHEIALDYSLLLLLFLVPVMLATAGQAVVGQFVPRTDRRGYSRWSMRVVLAAVSVVTAFLNVATGVYQATVLTERQHRIAVDHLAFPTHGLQASMYLSFLLAAFDLALVAVALITGPAAGHPTRSWYPEDLTPRWSAVFALPPSTEVNKA